ncbi:MAG: LysR family transcriptional regulator [Mesorhizobium sp.]|uniref:LysR family transcriptional regulator n=1 Tax=Mesorhizobium sp. TaxID=1871066 RepID=UPI000FE71861|nr:LysR family transcriptional regulator [Mesorhizobium sp.]RWE76219.1 MAG: LysR family transcriptional regulator [Mesorhizobium sp.]
MDTLTRMRAFIDVVEAEGFSAAARKIGRSKALLSKYVRELEDELGALLLNRTTRQFSLTEAGHTYYQRASEIVREVDSLAEAVRQSSGDVRGRIKLSAARTFADAPIGQSLVDTNGRSLANWRFKGEGEESISVAVSGPIEVNSPIVARAAALSGLGFAMLPDFIAAPDLASGKLVTALDDRILAGTGIFAVYPHRRYLPAKVRVFVDFLVHWFRTRDTGA